MCLYKGTAYLTILFEDENVVEARDVKICKSKDIVFDTIEDENDVFSIFQIRIFHLKKTTPGDDKNLKMEVSLRRKEGRGN